MTELPDQSRTRAEPLPEEGGTGSEETAAAILDESEERVAAAADGDAPGDAAVQHRTSEETA